MLPTFPDFLPPTFLLVDASQQIRPTRSQALRTPRATGELSLAELGLFADFSD